MKKIRDDRAQGILVVSLFYYKVKLNIRNIYHKTTLYPYVSKIM